ncbi:MAG: class C beta-lactamase-related serine hydrolase [Cytophagales bacterium]|nr:MAG: class C beta-lactamase-related serine hydrolase [Cytophagales bacterium]
MKKYTYIISQSIISIFIVFNIYLGITDQWVIYKILYHNLADLDDYKIFTNRPIVNHSKEKFDWKKSNTPVVLSSETNKLLQQLETTALLIVRNDTILLEKYYLGYDSTSISNSFSMAKSYVSTLIGIALKQQLIKSLDQSVGEFLVEFQTQEKSKITLRNCLMMSSGLNWKEDYLNPFSSVSQAYYGDDIQKLIYKLKATQPSGIRFEYKGSDTQILALVLEKIYQKSLSEITSEQLWTPLGAEHSGLWSLDKQNGKEKASCCLNATARDFALLGLLYLRKGNINLTQIIDSSYISISTSPINLPDKNKATTNYYGYQWWLLPEFGNENIYYARGVGGQYIIVIPSKNVIIVRLGKKRGKKKESSFEEVFQLVNEIKK